MLTILNVFDLLSTSRTSGELNITTRVVACLQSNTTEMMKLSSTCDARILEARSEKLLDTNIQTIVVYFRRLNED